MRIIDADELKKTAEYCELDSGSINQPSKTYIALEDVDNAPTVDLWHYPSKGEYPPLLEYVLCKLTDDTYEVGYYQGQIDGEPEWAFTCFLGDVVAWQYIMPPRASDFVKDDCLIDWMHDDITWCRRTKCPNKECFRNQVNRRLKAGLISVADMYVEGKCPKEAVLEV